MRIGYDGKRLFSNYTGLGNYSRYILSLVLRMFPEGENVIFTPKLSQNEIPDYKAKVIAPAGKYFTALWRSYGMIQDLLREKIDVYHGLSNELPVGIKSAKIPSVVTVHDLIFLRYPEYYKKIDAWIYKIKTRYACKNANCIIAISQQTKNDIINFFNIPEEKINVIYQNCDPIFKTLFTNAEKQEIAQAYKLPSKYLLSVGTIEPRKNLVLIVQALKLMPDISLVVIGKQKPYAGQVKKYINDNNLTDRVLFLNKVLFNDLPGIYQQAECFIYPSRYEGFGIPVLEALHSQVPVIAASGSCLEEAGGPGSLYTNPDNFRQLAELIQDVISNPGLRAKMIDAGNRHLLNFSDKLISDKLISVYKEAIYHVERGSR